VFLGSEGALSRSIFRGDGCLEKEETFIRTTKTWLWVREIKRYMRLIDEIDDGRWDDRLILRYDILSLSFSLGLNVVF